MFEVDLCVYLKLSFMFEIDARSLCLRFIFEGDVCVSCLKFMWSGVSTLSFDARIKTNTVVYARIAR